MSNLPMNGFVEKSTVSNRTLTADAMHDQTGITGELIDVGDFFPEHLFRVEVIDEGLGMIVVENLTIAVCNDDPVIEMIKDRNEINFTDIGGLLESSVVWV